MFDAGCVPTQFASAGRNPVTGDEKGNRVETIGLAHSSRTTWDSKTVRNPSVGSGPAKRDLGDDLPCSLLKRGATGLERSAEGRKGS